MLKQVAKLYERLIRPHTTNNALNSYSGGSPSSLCHCIGQNRRRYLICSRVWMDNVGVIIDVDNSITSPALQWKVMPSLSRLDFLGIERLKEEVNNWLHPWASQSPKSPIEIRMALPSIGELTVLWSRQRQSWHRHSPFKPLSRLNIDIDMVQWNGGDY